MTVWKNQRGDVPVGCLLGFVALVLIAIFAMNAVPAQLKLGDFERRISELAEDVAGGVRRRFRGAPDRHRAKPPCGQRRPKNPHAAA